MKGLTLQLMMAGSLAMAPAAFAQDLPGPGGSMSRFDAGATGSTTGSVPAPSERRERNTTPTPTTPDDPEHNGRSGYPAGAQSAPDTTTNPYNPGPTDTTRPYGGSPTDTTRGPDDTNLPAGKGNRTGAPNPSSGTTTSGTIGTPDTAGTRPGSTAADVPPVNGTAPTAGAEGDAQVVSKIHQANQKEIEMAQMALDKAESPRVKSYARKLLNDHQAADKKLMTYAEKKSLDMSKADQKTAMGTSGGTATPAPGSADTGDAHARLQNATGKDFDREFVNMMVDEHDKAIDLVKSAHDSVTDKQLRSQLGAMLPKLEQHRKMARDLADKQSKS